MKPNFPWGFWRFSPVCGCFPVVDGNDQDPALLVYDYSVWFF
jgi:hypothetical protein